MWSRIILITMSVKTHFNRVFSRILNKEIYTTYTHTQYIYIYRATTKCTIGATNGNLWNFPAHRDSLSPSPSFKTDACISTASNLTRFIYENGDYITHTHTQIHTSTGFRSLQQFNQTSSSGIKWENKMRRSVREKMEKNPQKRKHDEKSTTMKKRYH